MRLKSSQELVHQAVYPGLGLCPPGRTALFLICTKGLKRRCSNSASLRADVVHSTFQFVITTILFYNDLMSINSVPWPMFPILPEKCEIISGI